MHVFDVLTRLGAGKTKIVIVSGVEDELTIAECLRLGASGYVLEASSFEEVEFAIDAVLKGEIYQLATAGKTSAEIATALFISTRTAEAHRATAMKKLGLHTQTELVHYGLKQKWISP